MNENVSGLNGKYSAQFRKDAAETPAKKDQTIISHTSILEHGRDASGTRRVADLYEEVEATPECPVHSRVNRRCED
ncbi:MAG: hypothetical protein P8H66_09725 [Luminiphilus sp.]|nr:hypothetical protein [Luminiphilus sp.]